MGNRNKFWTKAGLARLGSIIRQSRERKQLTLREAEALIAKASDVKISYRTLNSVENASGVPTYNTLVAIAQLGLVERDGRALDIFDFIAIATEAHQDKEVPGMSALSRLIQDYLAAHNITLEEFAEITKVSFADLQAIAQGEQTPDYEGDLLLLCGHLHNPTTGMKFKNFPELLDYCGLRRNPATNRWEQSHAGTIQ